MNEQQYGSPTVSSVADGFDSDRVCKPRSVPHFQKRVGRAVRADVRGGRKRLGWPLSYIDDVVERWRKTNRLPARLGLRPVCGVADEDTRRNRL